MHGENEAAEPRLAQAKPREQPPDEQCVGRVQRDGDEVIAERVVTEEVPLDPEKRFVDRIVFGPTSGREPEFPQTVEVTHEWLVGNVPVVIPEPVAVHGGRVDPQDREDDGDDPEPGGERPAHEIVRGSKRGRGRGDRRGGLPFRTFGHGVIRLTESRGNCHSHN